MRTQVRHKEGLVNILSRDRECPFSILFVDRISVTPNRVSIHLSLKSAISELTCSSTQYWGAPGAPATAHRHRPPRRGARARPDARVSITLSLPHSLLNNTIVPNTET